MASCMYAAGCFVLQNLKSGGALADSPGRAAPFTSIPPAARPSTAGRQLSNGGSGASQASEDRERVAGSGLPDHLAARLDLAVDAGCERVCVLARVEPDDQVLPAPLDREAFLLEPVGQLARLVVRGEGDADLPGSKAALHGLLFPRLARRLVIPAILGVEPVLHGARDRRDVVVADLRLDHGARPLRLVAGRRVDEDVVLVLRDDEPARLEIACELGCLAGQPAEMKAVEEAARALLLDVDPDAEIVGYAGILPNSAIRRCSRCFVMPPRKKGYPAPRMRQASTSAGDPTTPSSRR